MINLKRIKIPDIKKIREWKGALTAELVQFPGKFGLGRLPKRLEPDATTTAVCGFCSTGCGLDIHLKNGEAINLSGKTDYPVNLGMACPKGWEALSPLDAPDRALTPLYRSTREGDPKPISWESAINLFCEKFKRVMDTHGSGSVAFLSSGQIATEEMAFLGALAKFGMGWIHGDSNTRQCMATAATAYKQSFGFDAPPYTYQDFEESDVIILIGSNICIAHPIMWQRVLRNKNKPEIIVIDPRKTETAVAATRHYALSPKSDLTLLYGIAHILIQEDWVKHTYIEAHTEGFEDFKEHTAHFTPQMVSETSGLSVKELYEFAYTIAHGKRVSFWWTMGVNQGHESTRTAQAIINLALMTANVGRPGTGANSITGQCNAMGSRLFSNTSSLFGGRDFTKASDRLCVADILAIPLDKIPVNNSLAYDQIIDGIDEGKIKGLWIIGTNTAHSWINQERFRRIAQKLEFLVVQDMYSTTDTAQIADLVLPAAGWGEKNGTMINSERRIGLIKKVRKAPGEALSDFNIFKLIANAWGCGAEFDRWNSPEEVFQIIKDISKDQPCDLTGIRDYQMIDHAHGIQWPFREGDILTSDQRRLFSDGLFFTPTNRAKFIFEMPNAPSEQINHHYPFILLTGRGSSSQWHTLTRSGKSDVLNALSPDCLCVEINQEDAALSNIYTGDSVTVESSRKKIICVARVTPNIKPGQLFMPMHFVEVNKLTQDSFDPYSRQPSYKYSAVKISKTKS
ncbi:MAG: nitrate reductase [Verrucomicrobiota bacterium]|nr:nitrate reductase [Verrucomicrobiota bacterium]